MFDTTKLKFDKVTLSDVHLLKELSICTFIQAFSAANEAEDIDSYTNDVFSAHSLRNQISSKNSTFIFAKCQDKIVGYYKLNIKDAQTEPMPVNHIELERIYVLDEFKNNGIGQCMVDEIVSTARKNGAEYIWLGVWDKNDGAIRFYQKNGFTVYANHAFQLGKDLQNDLLMIRPVNLL